MSSQSKFTVAENQCFRNESVISSTRSGMLRCSAGRHNSSSKMYSACWALKTVKYIFVTRGTSLFCIKGIKDRLSLNDTYLYSFMAKIVVAIVMTIANAIYSVHSGIGIIVIVGWLLAGATDDNNATAVLNMLVLRARQITIRDTVDNVASMGIRNFHTLLSEFVIEECAALDHEGA